MALWLRYVGPKTTLGFEVMTDILLIVVIGGMGTMYGSVIGAALFILALTVLAAHRCGLVVAPMPLLWRHAELTAALNRTAARAIVTTSRIDGVLYADFAMNAAAG